MKILVLCISVICLEANVLAQQSIVDQFEERSQTHDGFTLPYRLFVPADYDSQTSYPLVLALHGAGERGTDNERQIALHRLATSWADPVNQAVNPAFVVAPQVPPEDRWTAELPVDQSDFIDEEWTTLAILDSLAREFNIDQDRVYITGLSMGGHGTWDLISRLPDRFAAAVPMSGNADPTQASKLLHMPIWTFHGESDTVVRPYGARGLVQAMEDLGRDVVYTDCRRTPVTTINFDCPGAMSNGNLAAAIAEHADLIYTGAHNVGHGPWSVWYDHPLLAGWVFSKRRVIPNVIVIDEPSRGQSWSGTNSITWTSAATVTDTVEVWLSLDNGAGWEEIGTATISDLSYTIDSSNWPDAAVARVRLFVRDQNGRVYGRDTSGPFTIDNDGDASPVLDLDDEALRFDPEVYTETLDLTLIAADAEGGELTADVFYSIDGGGAFALAASSTLTSSVEPQTLSVDVASLPNSAQARLRVDLSDGVSSASVTTTSFVKATPRLTNQFVEHIAGEGQGTVTMHFVEPEALTSHRYRISFDGSNASGKTYSVADLDLGAPVLAGIPLSDGVRESPIFDGMSLVVEDLPVGKPNLEETGWISGETDLDVSIMGGSVLIAILRVQLLETENDYEITVTDVVADTSVAMFAIAAREIYFSVTSRGDGQRRKVLFKDAGGDGRLGGGDLLYILEDDSDGQPAPAWELRFSATAETRLPEVGDTFLFVPLRKLSAEDVFEFVAMLGVGTEEQPDPSGLEISVHPNPFVERTTIVYALSETSHVTMQVYDVSGRLVSVLTDQVVSAGEYRLGWNGTTGAGVRVAAGLYVLRLVTRFPESGKPRAVQQAVIRVR